MITAMPEVSEVSAVTERARGQLSFTDFVAHRQRALLRSVYLIVGNLQVAEDLLQEALIRLAVRWERVADGNPEAYLRRMLYRDVISWRARRRLRREADTAWTRERQIIVDESGASADRVALEAALRRLSHRQRAVVVLRYHEDLTEIQVAEILGISPGTVKSYAHTALKRLRADLPDVVTNSGRTPGKGEQ